jgi:hypothetical protein
VLDPSIWTTGALERSAPPVEAPPQLAAATDNPNTISVRIMHLTLFDPLCAAVSPMLNRRYIPEARSTFYVLRSTFYVRRRRPFVFRRRFGLHPNKYIHAGINGA